MTDTVKEKPMDVNRKLRSLLFKKGKIENKELESVLSELEKEQFVRSALSKKR
tara:strand:- start:799 stop:957 length:159 start_codon:yes stop_codon:yes gene_type:complete